MSFNSVPAELFLSRKTLTKIEDSINNSIQKFNADIDKRNTAKRELKKPQQKRKRANKGE